MGKRGDIVNELKTILTESTLFKKVYTAQTDPAKENSFPVVWALLGDETSSPSSLSTKFRKPVLTIRILVKNTLGQDALNDIMDSVMDLLSEKYTINGTVINCDYRYSITDDGRTYPLAMVDMVYEILMR